MSRFTTILWDVDNTLLDFDYSQRQALTECFCSLGREITEEQIRLYKRINDDYWKRLELGLVTREQLLEGRFVDFFRELGLKGIDVRAFRTAYQTGLANFFRINDDALTICRTLRKSVRQYVVTNGVTFTQKRKLELSGLAEVMDGIFISEEIGSPKPHRAFFSYCLAHIEEKDKSKILIVGDSMSSDIKGGMEAGIGTCWYRAGGKAREDRGDFCRRTQNLSHRPDKTPENPGSDVWTSQAEKGQAKREPDFVISDLHMLYDIIGSGPGYTAGFCDSE